MSILFSIMRIIPQLMTLRRYTYFGAVLFFGMWLAVLARKLDICTHDQTWQHKKNVQCTLGKSVGALELASQSVCSLHSAHGLTKKQRTSSRTLS